MPRCPACEAVLKPDVVMFGELLPEAAIERAFELARGTRLLLAVGSSLEVYPVAGLPLETLAAGGAFAIVNRGRPGSTRAPSSKLDAPAGETLAAVLEALRRGEFDVVVVGSGFGGSVAALRADREGLLGVRARGRAPVRPDDFPRTSWDLRRYLYAPRLGLHGIQRLTLLHDVLVLSGAGVGGGSLVYANTLYEPLEDVWRDPQWAAITDWKATSSRRTTTRRPADARRRERAVRDRRRPRDAPGRRADGRRRHLPPAPRSPSTSASRAEVGATRTSAATGPRRTRLHPLRRLHGRLPPRRQEHARPQLPLPRRAARRASSSPSARRRSCRAPTEAGRSRTERPGRAARRARETLPRRAGRARRRRARHAACCSCARGLGGLASLGERVRTNSEAIVGATARTREVDYSTGVAITSSIHPIADTHIEPVRYPRGSNAMGLLGTLLVDGGGRDAAPAALARRRSRATRSRSCAASRCGAGRSGRSSCS